MLRLSQKAWNNVVIFAMLFMVYLFTVSNDMLNDGDAGQAEVLPLFPPYSVVMSMDFGVARLDRIGQDWRVEGQPVEVLPKLVQIMETWSLLEALPFIAQPQSAPYIVTIQLAGENKKRVYQVYQHNDGVLLKLNADQYLVDGVQASQLFPENLTN